MTNALVIQKVGDTVMFRNKTLIFVFIILLLISGCGKSDNKNTSLNNIGTTMQVGTSVKSIDSIRQKSEYISAEKVIRRLSSEEFQGRKVYTEENKKAAQYISELFKAIGLEKYSKDSYMVGDNNIPIEIQNQHVVGVIPGKERSKAVVLTAHLDHIGKDTNGKTYLGALDDASGIGAIIDLAQLFMANSKALDQDVVICAINGEESGNLEAEVIIDDLKHRYKKLYNIDFDCIGAKDDNSVLLTGNKETGEKLMNGISGYFTQKGIKTDSIHQNEQGSFNEVFKMDNMDPITISFGTDSIAFFQKKINSVSIGQYVIFNGKTFNRMGLNENNLDKLTPKPNLIHSITDTPDKIDFKFIEKVSDIVYNFIMDNSGKEF